MSELLDAEVAKLLYLTTTKRDYVPKPYSRPRQIRGLQQFKDPVAEAFVKFLKIEKDVQPPYEDGDKYFEKVREKRSKRIQELHLKDPLNHFIINEEEVLMNKTEYQVDYCNIENEVRKKNYEGKKRPFRLPEGWEIAETTQKSEYKDPILLNKNALNPPLIIIPPTSIGQSETINDILQVKTGTSTYQDTIGKFGEFAVKHQVHGKLNHLKYEI